MADSPAAPQRPPTTIELALGHERVPLLVLLVAVPIVSWAWIAVMARDMYGPMTGASAWMMTARWDAPHLLLLWVMWAVMMVAMMLPSAAPMLLTYGVIARRSLRRSAAREIYALAAGYVLVWAAFSVIATGLQRLLATFLLLSSMMETTNKTAAAALLFVAGVYQLTPFKQACLHVCQSPLAFLMSRWRTGTFSAFALGLKHGAYCVGCCWGLMLILFVGGVMNLTVIAALTACVAFEKLSRAGAKGARISGAALIVAGIWMIAR